MKTTQITTQLSPMSVWDQIASFRRPMNAEELAKCLGLTPGQVYRYARKNELPSFRIGKNVRFDPA